MTMQVKIIPLIMSCLKDDDLGSRGRQGDGWTNEQGGCSRCRVSGCGGQQQQQQQQQPQAYLMDGKN